ncbi:HPP family protein [Amycolatopsis sp. GM8]|uniref:CBS domain-containing protein n=1 Tax=Amycolatopsis sp. GM8 TaxID=2896530 RepID=UPI001F2240D8|nr:CBS domain-containing protein [Amycolatopsis sp. GM8]
MTLQARHIMVTVPKRLGADARIAHVRAEFENDHVHLVLVVDRDGRLVTAIERADLTPGLDDSSFASACGRLEGRTVSATTPVTAIARLLGSTRRRLAVVDDHGRLLGLVCLKRSRRGYCDDDGVRARAQERGGTVPAPLPQDRFPSTPRR